MKEVKKNQNGITLVALVVTIVVLLILAGVTIALVMNNNSVINRAKDVRDLSGDKSVRELVSVAVMATQTDYFTDKGDFSDIPTTPAADKQAAINTAAGTSLQKELKNVGLDANLPTVTIINGVLKVESPVTVTLNGKSYAVTIDTAGATLEDKITVTPSAS